MADDPPTEPSPGPAAEPFPRPAAEPFTGPVLWYGAELAGREDDWALTLTAGQCAELRTAVHTARERGATLLRMTVGDFPLPTLAAPLARVAATLATGRGLALLRGVPADLLGEAEAGTVLRGIGQYLGRPVPQTADGRTLCHIRDAGELPYGGTGPVPATGPACPAGDPVPAYSAGTPVVAGPTGAPEPVRTGAAQPFRTAESDLLGLLCVRPARSGGSVLLAGAAAVHNTVLDTRPDLAELLYRSHTFGEVGEPGEERPYQTSPIVVRDGDRPSMRYDRGRLDGTGAELYDALDAAAASPAVRLEVDLRPGDLLLLDSHVVLHGRTAYEDVVGPGRGRHLLRLWLARETAPAVAADRARRGIAPRDVIRPRNLRTAPPGRARATDRRPR
ncbi:TauD/TfdA family dioxygenase [Streptomyces mangrovisoli]|uniref:TauD/TfdA-like domain-containing protein n=1 Tax=Streptomyces mangrovisoli TaxID=1428628 RepID=A0A1J4NUC5_9ACTN|nr:TauD/TfdA family dioxygenase [Streptomyces mangrovisoli]OIJ65116.1 hypothetical protein WN71_025225 [Streptomyces mangrovisoli]